MERTYLILGLSLILLGCVQSPDLKKTTEGCPISGAELQDMCDVDLELIMRIDNFEEDGFADCTYMGRDYEYKYRFVTGELDSVNSDIINETILFMENDSIPYQESDYGDRAIIYEEKVRYFKQGKDIINYTITNYTTSYNLLFEKGDRLYQITVHSNRGEEPGHCVSKGKMLELADLYAQKIG